MSGRTVRIVETQHAMADVTAKTRLACEKCQQRRGRTVSSLCRSDQVARAHPECTCVNKPATCDELFECTVKRE